MLMKKILFIHLKIIFDLDIYQFIMIILKNTFLIHFIK